jgi:hypothetical protein
MAQIWHQMNWIKVFLDPNFQDWPNCIKPTSTIESSSSTFVIELSPILDPITCQLGLLPNRLGPKYLKIHNDRNTLTLESVDINIP